MGAAREGVDELTTLFQEYVSAADAGEDPALASFLERAGARAAELERRIEVLLGLRELGALGSLDERGELEAFETPSELGRFRVLGLLGTGGLSRVLLAEDPELGRQVALKVLSDARFLSREARGWIKNEGQVLARLRHPSVVRVLEMGEAEGLPFLVMELVDGPSLGEALAALRGVRRAEGLERHSARALDAGLALESTTARVRVGLALARALAACHEAGVLHRDLKPSNVLLEGGREPRLIDFGLGNLAAREDSLTDVTQALVGTPAHLSPEQVEQGRTLASAASDQFALGTMLYELVTLESPFARETRSATLSAVAAAAPKPPRKIDARIPADLERIVLCALGREPSDRYPSVAGLADDLEAFLEHRAIQARRPSPARRLRLWAKRHRREVLVGGSALLAAALILPGRELLAVRAELSALEDELAALPPRESLVRPEQFEDELHRLRSLALRASGLDGVASRILGEDPTAQVERRLQATCERLSKVFWTKRDAASASPGTEAAPERRQLVQQWSGALELYESLCSPASIDTRLTSLGRVEAVPFEGLEARFLRFEYEAPDAFVRLVPVEAPERREFGWYRATWVDDEGKVRRARDFLLRPENPLLVLESREPAPIWLSRMVAALEGRLDITPGLPMREVGASRILPELVLWRDLAEAGFTVPEEADPGEPARVSLETAAEFAATVGLRLPLALEWRHAMQRPDLTPDDCVAGELMLGMQIAGSPVVFLNNELDPGSEKRNRMLVNEQLNWNDLGFRLAWEADR